MHSLGQGHKGIKGNEGGAVRETRSGNVHKASGDKEGNRKERDGRVVDTPRKRKKGKWCRFLFRVHMVREMVTKVH